jgi:hypothetical protein
MINLTQSTDGFIRMNRHFPENSSIEIAFTDGTSEVMTGRQLNVVYDEAVVAFRAQNGLDAKGFNRGKPTTVQPKNKIDLVPVRPGMAS